MSALSESVKVCGAEALALLGLMKQQDGLAAADSGKLKAALEAVLATAEVGRDKESLCLRSCFVIRWLISPLM